MSKMSGCCCDFVGGKRVEKRYVSGGKDDDYGRETKRGIIT